MYFFSFLFFSKRWGGGGGGKQGPAPAWALISYCVSNNASVVYFCFFKFFNFFLLFWPSHIRVLVSRLQGYPSIEHLYQADSLLARELVHRSTNLFTTLSSEKFCFLLIRSSNCLIYYTITMFQAHQLSSFCLFHVACMYTTEEEPANKLYLCWFLNTAARLSLVDQFISFIWPVHRSRVGT